MDRVPQGSAVMFYLCLNLEALGLPFTAFFYAQEGQDIGSSWSAAPTNSVFWALGFLHATTAKSSSCNFQLSPAVKCMDMAEPGLSRQAADDSEIRN